MSRIGKLPITIPEGVNASVTDGAVIIKGKKGELTSAFTSDVKVELQDNILSVQPANETQKSRAMWGTIRSILENMVTGVSEGFIVRLEINGVGYRAALKGNILTLMLGYSHDIKYAVPKDIEVKCEKPTLLVISGADKQKVGQVAAEIMNMRPFEPYKGKGVFKEGKPGRRKEGKKK